MTTSAAGALKTLNGHGLTAVFRESTNRWLIYHGQRIVMSVRTLEDAINHYHDEGWPQTPPKGDGLLDAPPDEGPVARVPVDEGKEPTVKRKQPSGADRMPNGDLARLVMGYMYLRGPNRALMTAEITEAVEKVTMAHFRLKGTPGASLSWLESKKGAVKQVGRGLWKLGHSAYRPAVWAGDRSLFDREGRPRKDLDFGGGLVWRKGQDRVAAAMDAALAADQADSSPVVEDEHVVVEPPVYDLPVDAVRAGTLADGREVYAADGQLWVKNTVVVYHRL